MAGMILKVTPVEMKNKAASIEKKISEVEKSFGEIDKIIKATQRYWIGEASDQHIQNYEKKTDDIDNAIKNLKEHPVDLRKMAGIYEEAEDTAQQLAAALPIDIF